MSLLQELAAGDTFTLAAFNAHTLVRTRRFQEALVLYDELLAEKPERADLWVNRGVTLQALYRLEEALESFTTALRYRGSDLGAIINRGAALGWLGRYSEALTDYNRAVALDPDDEAARLGRSVVLGSLGQHDAALQDSDYVLANNPGHGGAHYNKSLLLLSKGDYAEGLREHEWRFGTEWVLGRQRFKQPVWTGQKTDKPILVHCEQGLGDNLQFARYLPKMRGLNVTIEAPKQLSRLFQQFGFPVVERDNPLPEFAFHVPMMSLGTIFGTTIDTVPTENYLSSNWYETNRWEQRLRELPGKKVGLSWSSGIRSEQPIAVAMQRRKSIPTALAKAYLLDIPGINFVSLQKDMPDDGTLPIYDPMSQVKDLADTAAIIANLDLVVTVDSAVAHLAGAMGKPVWVLNRYDICWRWLSGDMESPWYPSAKIYRQAQPMHWDAVLRQLRTDLTTFGVDNA